MNLIYHSCSPFRSYIEQEEKKPHTNIDFITRKKNCHLNKIISTFLIGSTCKNEKEKAYMVCVLMTGWQEGKNWSQFQKKVRFTVRTTKEVEK